MGSINSDNRGGRWMKIYQPNLVIVTEPDKSAARKIAGVLIEKKLAACVNIPPSRVSI